MNEKIETEKKMKRQKMLTSERKEKHMKKLRKRRVFVIGRRFQYE